MSTEFHTIEFWAARPTLELRLLGRASSSGREDDKGDKQRKRLDDYEVRGQAIAGKLHMDSPNTYFKVCFRSAIGISHVQAVAYHAPG